MKEEYHTGWSLLRHILMCRDLHQGNVLVTEIYRESSLWASEEHSAVLIDFGRGQWTLSDRSEYRSSTYAERPEAEQQDIFDYGCLIMDLTQQWMAVTNRKHLPQILFDVISNCTFPERRVTVTMNDITSIWENDFIGRTAPRLEKYQVHSVDAWELLQQSKEGLAEIQVDSVNAWEICHERAKKSLYSSTRSRPSAQKIGYMLRNISVEKLD